MESGQNLPDFLHEVDFLAARFFPKKRGYTKFYMEGGRIEDNKGLIKVLNRTMRKIGSGLGYLVVKELVNEKCLSTTLTPREPQSTYRRTTCKKYQRTCLTSWVWKVVYT